MKAPTAGVGITYFFELEPLLSPALGLVDVLEIEPQVFWKHTQSNPDIYQVDEDALAKIETYSQPKLMHSVGSLGGSCSPDLAQMPALLRMKNELHPLWVSDHLSFNAACGPDGPFKTGFLLPLCQNSEGVKTAAKAIKLMKNHLRIDLAVETGVSYLKQRHDEMTDGEFVGAVSSAADCGLLLDMHNVWTNQNNGRQSVSDYLDQIPLGRVWELHMAGGYEEDGYWLDAHSGEMQDEMLRIAKNIIPRLPNLKAIIFEIYPSFLPEVGLEVVRKQLKTIHRLWKMRGNGHSTARAQMLRKRIRKAPMTTPDPISPQKWENILGALVVGRIPRGELAKELATDPGISLYRKLIASFRASMVVGTLILTSRLLLLTLGKKSFLALLEEYWKDQTPMLFASDEAEGFSKYLRLLRLDLPYLEEVLEFEMAARNANLRGEEQIVRFPYEPFPLLRALGSRKLPSPPPRRGHYEIVITPDTANVSRGRTEGKPPLSRLDGSRQLVWHH